MPQSKISKNIVMLNNKIKTLIKKIMIKNSYRQEIYFPKHVFDYMKLIYLRYSYESVIYLYNTLYNLDKLEKLTVPNLYLKKINWYSGLKKHIWFVTESCNILYVYLYVILKCDHRNFVNKFF